jgi:hypothetical protein
MRHLLWLSCAALFACGGSVVDESSSSGDAGSGTSGANGATSTGAGPTSGPTATAGSGEGSGGSGDGGATPGVGGGAGVGGESPTGGGGLGPGSGGFGPGSGGFGPGSGGAGGTTGSGEPPIACGQAECDPATEICCATFNGASCIDAGDDCQGAAILCTSAANCGDGEVCCGTFGGGSGQASCTSEPCGEDGPMSGIQLCASDAECPPDRPCVEAPGGVGIMYCDAGFGI